MSCAISSYYYQALLPGPDQIRLLRLLPNEDENAPIQCQLFSFTLQESGKRTNPYDALSYTWGDLDNPQSISIGKDTMNVTINLHRALSCLRHNFIERILWVDAVCINQEDTSEKGQQIRLMTKIYARANCVVIWLGEAADCSDQALEDIRIAGGGKKTSSSSTPGINQQAIRTLLRRPWFRRIWVLQEVAAARHIRIICGATEIDGYAFCSGLGSLDLYQADPDLRSLIQSVTYLIREAIFRPSYVISGLRRSSLDIRPLGELIDMYHGHEATERHDKVYALLGMSSDDLSKSSLLPDYGVPWRKLLQDLVKFLLYENISAVTLPYKQIALIKSKGSVLGKISSVQSDIAWDESQSVDVIFENTSRQSTYMEERSAHWTLHASVKSIRGGDLVCLLRGASKPTIIRLCDDHFEIIMIAATPLEKILKLGQSKKPFTRDFLLIWDWEKLPREGEYEKLLQRHNWASEHSKIELEGHLGKATRTWKVAMILEDSEEYGKAQEKIREAIEGYEIAAVEGHEAMVKQLLETGEIDVDFKLKDGTTPLWWAAKEGHETVIKLLLGTGKVNVDSKFKDGTTPLWWAAQGGYLAAVERLLQEKADINARAAGIFGMTVLQAAAEGGYLDVVKHLLQEKADINAAPAESCGRTALQAAAGGGHLAVVKRLLQEKANINAAPAEYYGRTALQAAAGGGHLAVVKQLLQKKADVNAEAGRIVGMTALQAAAVGGHLAVVEQLLQDRADVNAVGAISYGRTALQAAAGGGHLAVVKRLLQEKANINAAPAEYYGRTALQAAAGGGHLAVVERLLQEKADINAPAAKIKGRTALQAASEGGHLDVVVRLLQEKADVNAPAGERSGKTALESAKEGGHLAVVECLLNHLKQR